MHGLRRTHCKDRVALCSTHSNQYFFLSFKIKGEKINIFFIDRVHYSSVVHNRTHCKKSTSTKKKISKLTRIVKCAGSTQESL